MIQATKFDAGPQTIYIFRQPGDPISPIRRPPHSNILLIGDIMPQMKQLIADHTRQQFQEQILPLSANAHHQLLQYLNGRTHMATNNELSHYHHWLHYSTGRSTSRIDLIVNLLNENGRWAKTQNANILLVGIDTAALRQALIDDGPTIKETFNLSKNAYTSLRQHVGLDSPHGRPKRTATAVTA